MRFERILDDNRLWAVEYEGAQSNCFDLLFSQWYDMNWLRGFFKENLADLSTFFHITDVYEAVLETIDEAKRLECLMLDISPSADLDVLFKHLENTRFSEMALGREKTKGDGSYRHPSWLRQWPNEATHLLNSPRWNGLETICLIIVCLIWMVLTII